MDDKGRFDGQGDNPFLPVSDVSGEGSGGESAPAPKIEGYEILHKIGEAGQGQVWCAIQQSTERKVAIKVPRFYGFGARKAFQRFEREVQLVARLKHPNIARVYDSGVNRGLYYFTMEYIDGRHLDRYVAEEKLSEEEILVLIRRVCLAVQYAHQNAVIHRDLKPSNILVTSDGQPHIVDFGLAKGLMETDMTVTISQEDQPAGTPAYMSPEQAAGSPDGIDTRTDIYSIGVILYQMLTGTLPHDMSGGRQTVLNRISSEPIVKPQLARPGLNKELGYILQKALAEEPARRYSTAQEFATDIQNYLNGSALIAGPESAFYIAGKYIQRHKGVVFGSLAGVVLLVVGLIVTSTLYLQAEAARREVAEALQREERQNYAHTIQLAQSRINAGDFHFVRKMLEDTKPDLRNWEWGYLMKQCQRPEWAFNPGGQTDCVTMSADGRYLLLFDSLGKNASLLNADDRSVLWEKKIAECIPKFVHAAFDPAGRFVAVASGIKLVVFETGSGDILYESKGTGFLSCCAEPEGRLYAGAFDGQVVVYDTAEWQVLSTTQLEGKITHLDVCEKSNSLTAISGTQTLTILDSESLQEKGTFSERGTVLGAVQVCSKLNKLMLARGYGVDIRDLDGPIEAKAVTKLKDHTQEVTAMDLSDDLSMLMTGGLDGMVYVYDTQSWQQLGKVYHDSPVLNVQFAPEDKMITVGTDGSVKFWEDFKHEQTNPNVSIELPDSVSPWRFDYSEDGRQIVFFSSRHKTIIIEDVQSGQRTALEIDDYPEDAAYPKIQTFYRPGTSELVVIVQDTLRIYKLGENGYSEDRRFELPAGSYRAAMDPKGGFMAVSSARNAGLIINLDNGVTYNLKANASLPVITVSHDGSTIASMEWNGSRQIFVFDSRTGGMINMIRTGFQSQTQSLAIHPEKQVVAAGDTDGFIGVWDIRSGKVIEQIRGGNLGAIFTLQLSRDGQRLISGSQDNTLRVWDWKVGQALLTLEQNSSPLNVSFSPDGLSVAATDDDPDEVYIYRSISWQTE